MRISFAVESKKIYKMASDRGIKETATNISKGKRFTYRIIELLLRPFEYLF